MKISALRSASLLTLSVIGLSFAASCGGSQEPEDPAATGGGSGLGGEGGTGNVQSCDDAPTWELPADTEMHTCSSIEGKRCLPEDVMHRHAIAYSGYRTGQDPRTETYPSKEEILEDLKLLEKGGWTLLRLFDSGVHGQRTVEVIAENDLDMKVQLGVWIDGPKETDDEANQIQIENGIALATEYEDIVISVSVGNEVLDDWSSVRTPPEDLAEYILQVRDEITQPVATDDMYIPFQMQGQYAEVEQVIDVVDFLSVHVYAFIDAQWSWAWKQLDVPDGPERAPAMMAEGFEYTKAAFKNVRTALMLKDLDLPLVIGEAGWKSRPTKPAVEAGEAFRAHPVNQKIFYEQLMNWVYGEGRDADSPAGAFYFEAFDEPWKGQDDGWGLFSVDREAKFVIACDFPELVPEGEPAYTLDDAVYYTEITE